jgi:hypothetical protein
MVACRVASQFACCVASENSASDCMKILRQDIWPGQRRSLF